MSTKKEKCCEKCDAGTDNCENVNCLCHKAPKGKMVHEYKERIFPENIEEVIGDPSSVQSESIEWEEKIRFAARLRPTTEEDAMKYADEAIEAVNKAITTAVAKRELELVEEVERLPEMPGNHGDLGANLIDRADVLSILKH